MIIGDGEYLGAEFWVQQRVASCPVKDIPQNILLPQGEQGDNDKKKLKNNGNGNGNGNAVNEIDKVNLMKQNIYDRAENAQASMVEKEKKKSKKQIIEEKKKIEHGLEFHFDKDEQAAEEDSWIHPKYSTATYLDARIDGHPQGERL